MNEMAARPAQPMWRRIVNFPLMSLIIAAFVTLFGIGLVNQLLRMALPNMGKDQLVLLIDVVAVVVMILIYKLVIRHLGEIKRDDLSGPGALRQTLAGLGVGFGLFSFIVLIAALIGVYTITGRGDLSLLVTALITDGLFPAVSEELLFRGILFRWIEEFGGSWAALILTSLLFGASHLANPNATYIAAAGIALEAGVMLGAAYMLTRRLWFPMGIHAAWNVAQGELYDIPVSGLPVHGVVDAKLQGPPLLTGNGFGLEASLIAIVIATLFGLYLLVRAIRAGELMQPWWVRRRAAHQTVAVEAGR
jgi:membrane protease YdiL (CAAX protease family)